MLAINMADVVNVLNTCKPYLIGFGIVLAIEQVPVLYLMHMRQYLYFRDWKMQDLN